MASRSRLVSACAPTERLNERGRRKCPLDEVTEETRTEVGQLIEYEEHTAGFLMNKEFLALPQTSTVSDAIQALKQNDELLDGLEKLEGWPEKAGSAATKLPQGI